MDKTTISNKKYRLAALLQKKRARINSLLLKPELDKKEQAYIAEEGELINIVNEIITALEGDDARVMPNVVDLEEAVLGAIILGTEALSEILPFLKVEHFYDHKFAKIYQAILNLSSRNRPVDMRTVVLQLRRDGEIEFVGGTIMIAELTSKVSSAANLKYHATVVVEFAMKRALIGIGGALINDGHDDQVDVFDLLEAVDTELVKIKEPLNHGRS